MATRLLAPPNSDSSAFVSQSGNCNTLLDQCLLATDDTNEEINNGALVTFIRLMGKTGVCTHLIDEPVLCKVLDCSIKILMHREFIDVLLPWVSRIVHDASNIQSQAKQSSQSMKAPKHN